MNTRRNALYPIAVRRRREFINSIEGAALALTILVSVDLAVGQSITRGPYLQNSTTNSIVVRWRTDSPVASAVRFGLQVDTQTSIASDSTPKTDHAITLSNLAAGTDYFYSIVNGESVLVGGTNYTFGTNPNTARGTRIWAIGDVGTAALGSSTPLAVRNAYQQFTGSRRTDVWLMLGDNAYSSGTDAEYQAAVFDVFGDLLRSTPLWSTLGNHETYGADANGNIAFTDIFSLPQDGRAGGVPSGTERYYSFDYANIHFVCLDSELSDKSSSGPMLTWLGQDLAANSQVWTIAFWHSPPYSKGSHDSDFESNLVLMRQNALPILESYGVDLVLSGHSHSFERSYMLAGHFGLASSLTAEMILDSHSGNPAQTGAYVKSSGGSQAGTVYVVAGSAGQTSGGALNHPAMFASLNRLGSLVLDVEGNRMDVKFLRETGDVDDQFSIIKGDVPARIVVGPQAQTVLAGQSAEFSVTATGTPTLTYQWRFNDQPIPGANASTLNLPNVLPTAAGNYSAAVSNQFGGEVSASASLVVIDVSTNCLSSGLVAWWPFNQNSLDWVAANNATLTGGPFYAAGVVSAGLVMDGVNDHGFVAPSASIDVGQGNGFTLDLWIKPANIGSSLTMAEWSDTSSTLGVHFVVTTHSVGDLYANLVDRNGVSHSFSAPGGTITAQQFQHVALTYDKATGIGRMYRNGVKVAESALGVFVPETRTGLYFGRRIIGGSAYRFNGVMDEVGLYNRALGSNEINAIYITGGAGRCPAFDAPEAPMITANPTNVTASVGGTASFAVQAVGDPPLKYQWYHDDVPLLGMTNSILELSNLSFVDTGAYAVVVSNPASSTRSSDAMLTVLIPGTPGCLPVPPGISAWFPFNGNVNEAISGIPASAVGSPAFGAGAVAQSLRFDGVDDSVTVTRSSAIDIGTASSMSVEMWVKPNQLAQTEVLLEWSTTDGTLGLHFHHSLAAAGGGPGSLFVNMRDRVGNSVHFSTPPGILIVGVFQHVAFTYDRATGVTRFYRNGSLVAQGSVGNILLETRTDLWIGRRSHGGTAYRFSGNLDEITLYRRALGADEIMAIYATGSAGKCGGQSAPVIITQPTSRTVVVGETTTFSTSAVGDHPLSYQWYFGQSSLANATNESLTLANVGFANAGSYYAVVLNSLGSATSAVATLTVTDPPARVRVVSVDALSGTTVEVPVELSANGNENALGFSLNFDPTRVAFVSAALGTNAVNGSLLVNVDQIASGRAGLAITLGAGQTFARGIQQVARVTFAVAPSSSVVNSLITFGDSPVQRQISNVGAGALPGVYEAGTISVLPTTIRAMNVETVTGGSVAVPISLLALGNENGISFSVTFDPSLLSLVGVVPAAGASGNASVLVNPSLANSGRVGISIALPAGETFASGPHSLVEVQFEVATVLDSTTTVIGFGDSPTVRQVANASAQLLPAVFQSGTISVVATDFEADTAPRPGGDRTLTIIDWVQVGRYAAALDTVSPEEFQSADCAPRSTRGNGVISVADWVQAGRYSAGLDPITGIGGPTGPLAPGGGIAPAGIALAGASGCQVRITNTNVLPGEVVNVPVVVNATGTENALGFSVSFDTSRLEFVSATKVGAGSVATLNLNTSAAASGRLGVALALPINSSFTPGLQQILLVTFHALPATSGTASVAFGDSPVLREAVSVTASTVPCTFIGGQITLGPPPVSGPTLSISRSGDSIVLYWSAAETGFELYTADAPRDAEWTKVTAAPLEIGGQKIVTVPRSGLQKYFRLRKP